MSAFFKLTNYYPHTIYLSIDHAFAHIEKNIFLSLQVLTFKTPNGLRTMRTHPNKKTMKIYNNNGYS